MESNPGTQPASRQRLYQPLSPTEYRVVHLLPGKFSHDIQCTLETRSILVRASYEALSYQWGDETITKPIHIARPKEAPTVVSGLLDHFLLQRVLHYASSPYRLLCQLDRDYPFPLYLVLACYIAFLLWQVTLPNITLPRWAPLFIPKEAYRAVPGLIGGACSSYFLSQLFRIIKEIIDTRLWRVWAIGFSWRSRKLAPALSDDMQILHVTTNLEAALRHLRREKTPRTLWIDALCIDQHNESEKLVQVQRMDWIFANASLVLIWLGGYHDASKGENCEEDPGSCKHRAQIEAAFADARVARWWMIQPLLKWLVSWTRDEKFYQNSDEGLLNIMKRGWWRRLWVIQEVALATGHVQIQCGHSTCSYNLFAAGSNFMVLRHLKNQQYLDHCSSSQDFKDVVDDFGYSLYANQNGRNTVKGSHQSLYQGSLVKDHGMKERAFARRLGIILLRTSGRFNCRDDRDRLYAVLGIAGRAVSGENDKVAALVNTFGSMLTSAAICHYFGWLAECFYPQEKLMGRILVAAVTLGAVVYETRANHWTISRPDYLIGVSSHLIESVIGAPGDKVDRVELFTKLVGYLANQTKRLFFLDLANCGEDKDPAMPSWVPNWSRALTESAYKYTKKQHIQNTFSFADGGKTIELSGQRLSILAVCTPEDLAGMESRPWYNALVKLAALPEDSVRVLQPFLRKMQAGIEPGEFNNLREDQRMEVLAYQSFFGVLLRGLATRLSQDGTTIVHSASPRVDYRGGEIGYLRSGTVAMGDDLVMIPGCFHYLVLRPQAQRAGGNPSWRLVGLVEMDVKNEGPNYSSSEWKQLREDGKLCNYVIE